MAETERATLRRRRRQARRRRMVAGGAGVVVVATGGAVALGAASADPPGHRYATIGRATVTQVVEASGTISSSAKVAAAFPVSGTVRSVAVRVGQSVAKGQLLARLDTTSLQGAVDSAESSLAQARQKLVADEDGQTDSSSSNSADSSSSFSGDTATYTALTTTAATAGNGSDPLLGKIRAAQQAVLAAQKDVDAGQAAVDAARTDVVNDVAHDAQLRDAQRAACATSSDGSTGPDTAGCASARADYEAYADTLTSDGHALDAAVSAQDGRLAKLDSEISALDKLLGQVSSTSGGSSGSPSTGPSTHPTSPSPQPTTGSTSHPTTGRTSHPTTGSSSHPTTGSSSQPTTGSTTTTASAAQLAADQAQVDAAAAAVRSAKQDLAAATLRSPISGKVAAVGLTTGSSASGSSITIVGTGVRKVTAAVPLAQIGSVKVGQPVTVAADGVTKVLHGKVTAIGLLSSTSGSVTSFPVTVQLDPGSPGLFDGAGADVRITTGTARDVVAVPNSAIHTAGRGFHSVTVVRGSSSSTVRVTLGVAGPALTQVLSGLHVGDRVVIADYSQSVPASSTSDSSTRRGFVFGGRNSPFLGGR